jgi:hypothetical protein
MLTDGQTDGHDEIDNRYSRLRGNRLKFKKKLNLEKKIEDTF